MKPVLEIRNLNKAFGGLQVIQDLDLAVGSGEILSIIGPNGAGKTTLFNMITGVYVPDSGDIIMEGDSIAGLVPHKIANRGIGRFGLG